MIYHEVGHMLDNVPGLKDIFTKAVEKEGNLSWVSNLVINPKALKAGRVPDPYYGDTDATQTYSGFGASEQWADAFANYVAGNIDLDTDPGKEMNTFVTNALAPYIGNP